MSVCRVFTCVTGRRCLLWPVCSLHRTLSVFALFCFVLQGQHCLLLQVSLESLVLHSSPQYEKDICFFFFFLVLVLEGLVGPHWTIQLQLLQHYCLGHRLVLLWYWMVCRGNVQRLFCLFFFFFVVDFVIHWNSVIFENTPKFCILNCFVYYVGYSISSKRCLPSGVDVTVIWIKK